MSEVSDTCVCGAESTRGCHVVQDGVIIDSYPCDDCYNKRGNK